MCGFICQRFSPTSLERALFTQPNCFEIYPCCYMYEVHSFVLLSSIRCMGNSTLCLFIHLLVGICFSSFSVTDDGAVNIHV